MQTKAPFHYGGRTFRSLAEIKRHVQAAIDYNNRVIDREFFDPVLADLVVDRHYRWMHFGIRPTIFKFMANRVDDSRLWGDSLAGYFPGRGWNRFSYQKALRTQPVTLESEFKRLCRERWKLLWQPRYIFPCMKCSVPGCDWFAEDVDHIQPQHEDIVKACWALVDEATATGWWRLLMEQPEDSHFILPNDHPVSRLYDDMTRNGTFQAVCKEHHREAAKTR